MPTDLYRFLDGSDEKPVLKVNGRPPASISATDTPASAATGRTATPSSSCCPCPSAGSSRTTRRPRTGAGSPSSVARSSMRSRASTGDRVFDLVLPDAAPLGRRIPARPAERCRGHKGGRDRRRPYYSWANPRPGPDARLASPHLRRSQAPPKRQHERRLTGSSTGPSGPERPREGCPSRPVSAMIRDRPVKEGS